MSIRAVDIAHVAHVGQKDKQGQPYILHPWRVAQEMTNFPYPPQTPLVETSWLHDVVEDTDLTLGNLKELGVEEGVIRSVSLLTHSWPDDYEEFITRIIDSKDRSAILVKIADIKDNLRPGGNPFKQKRDYLPALKRLTLAAKELHFI